MVKFPRSAVMSSLQGFGEMEVHVSGEASGLSFVGVDTVRVLYADLKAKPAASGNDGPWKRALGLSGGSVSGGSAEVRFEVPGPGFVTLSIYDVQGRLVRRLVDEPMEANTYIIDWNGMDDAGARVAGGVYFLRLETGDESVTGKAVIVR